MKALLTTLAIALVMVMATPSMSQDTDDLQINKFGIGLHVEQFKMIDLMSYDFVPLNKLILSISPSEKFRIEPSIGFSSSKSEEDDDTYNEKDTNSGVFFGIGALGMKQVGSTNIYYGIRFEYGNLTSKNESTNYSRTVTSRRIMVGPVVGAEYFLGKHFSFGGEIALKNYSSKNKFEYSDPDNNFETTGSLFSTESGLLIRFYF